MATDMVTLPNLSPAPGGGQGAYGAVPGQIGQPASTYGQVAQIAPGLPQLTRTGTGVVGSELAGEISPETQNFIQQKAAEFGVGSGMPGSDFSRHNLVRSLGLTSEQLQHQGIADYAGLLGATAPTQVTPETQAAIAEQNAVNAAAPNPAAAAQAMLDAQEAGYKLANPSGVGGVSGYDLSGATNIYGKSTPNLAPWQIAAGWKSYY